MLLTEADTCRKFVVPRLQRAGWDDPPHAINEQWTFTDGRVIFVRGEARRGQDRGGLPDLLEAVEGRLERRRRGPQTEDPVPGRPQRPGG